MLSFKRSFNKHHFHWGSLALFLMFIVGCFGPDRESPEQKAHKMSTGQVVADFRVTSVGQENIILDDLKRYKHWKIPRQVDYVFKACIEDKVYQRNVVNQTFVIQKSSQTYSAHTCLLYTSPSPRDRTRSRMPSSA